MALCAFSRAQRAMPKPDAKHVSEHSCCTPNHPLLHARFAAQSVADSHFSCLVVPSGGTSCRGLGGEGPVVR